MLSYRIYLSIIPVFMMNVKIIYLDLDIIYELLID